VGIIDKVWIKVSCENCNISDVSSAADKGSGWSGSSWNSLAGFKNFDVTADGSGKEEPSIISAKCQQCGSDAKVLSEYGFNKPKEF